MYSFFAVHYVCSLSPVYTPNAFIVVHYSNSLHGVSLLPPYSLWVTILIPVFVVHNSCYIFRGPLFPFFSSWFTFPAPSSTACYPQSFFRGSLPQLYSSLVTIPNPFSVVHYYPHPPPSPYPPFYNVIQFPCALSRGSPYLSFSW